MELMVRVAVPVFLSATSWAAVVVPTVDAGKAIDAGVSETTGADPAAPVPLRITACGEPVALSAIESEALKAPVVTGLNSTDTVHVAATASVVPQVVADLMNEVAFVPLMVSEVRFSVAVPEFLMVTTCATVVEPTGVDANVREVGVSVTAGAAVAAFTLTVSRPKSVHREAQVVRLKTTLLMFGPDSSRAPR